MDYSMKRLCTICARGGSKGLPGKNIRPLLARPLLAWTVEVARETGLFDEIAVSSDSAEILATAAEAGVDLLVKRPTELGSDTAGKLPAIQHCVVEAEERSGEIFDVVVDLDVTSPLRLTKDISGAVALLEASDATNVITGSPARRSPYFNLVERSSDGFAGLSKRPAGGTLIRRQDAPACFDMNASIYVWWRDALLRGGAVFMERTLLYEMPEDRSVDIDSALDFEIVRLLLEQRIKAT